VDPDDTHDALFDALKRGFSREYIDPEGYVKHTVSTLNTYMHVYATQKSNYVAPYTSLVTSSLMGKSRLLKQIAALVPTVYVCLRKSTASYGYPKQTPNLVDWFSQGALSLAGKNETDAYYFCFPTLKYALFLVVTIRKLVEWIQNGEFLESLRKKVDNGSKFEFGWLWEFFAEPPDEDCLRLFWADVTNSINEEFRQRATGHKAHAYFVNRFRNDIQSAMRSFRECLALDEVHDTSLDLLFMFDEARVLCEVEAMDGGPILDESPLADATDSFNPAKDFRRNPHASFSNFRALRRALRFSSATKSPGIFAVLTDTNSRITNFQPTSWLDNSGRVPSLPAPGPNQFPPIFTFTSVDANSRMYNELMCTSCPQKVADPTRLLKFGRVGWYSVYCEGDDDIGDVKGAAVLDLATTKLLATPDLQQVDTPWGAKRPLHQRDLIRLLAVLAPRLAITVGPSTVEASEFIASHLACLTHTDSERHFLRTVYPSEPILAQVSAQLTHKYGWDRPLLALHHYVQGGIVEGGYRGELLTKIVCLMAMDRALATITPPAGQWSFARPITVSQFLNNLIAPLRNNNTFTAGLHGIKPGEEILPNTLNVDDIRLNVFLAGHVFFNHFIRVDVKLSYPMLAHAWNRGAAIMCMTNTKGIDHVIPVMLPEADHAKFGPLHGIWNEEQIKESRRHLSYILINSENYSSPKQHLNAAWAAKLSPRNIRSIPLKQTDDEDDDGVRMGGLETGDTTTDESHMNMQYIEDGSEQTTSGDEEREVEDTVDYNDPQNVFMSLVQDFGKKLVNEEWVSVGGIRSVRQNLRCAPCPPKSQFFAILKGVGSETYKCLQDIAGERHDRKARRARTRDYLKELQQARVEYVKKDPGNPMAFIGGMQNLPLVYGEGMLGSQKWDTLRRKAREA
jgi:hypothetical protein